MNAPSTTLESPHRQFLFMPSSTFGPAPQVFAESKNSAGDSVLVMKDVPIFRTGTFSDMYGEEMTWEDSHISQMVQNFEELQRRKILPDVPIRKGHPSMSLFGPPDGAAVMDALVGYITGARFREETNPEDGLKYHYLFADFEIIDEVAQKKVKSGLWRNLSAEIGPTRSGSGAEFWPTLRGVAYVDFGAVKGLRLHAQEQGQYSTLMMEEGMSGTAQGQPNQAPQNPNPAPPAPAAPAAPAPAPQQQFSFQLGDRTCSDFGEVQTFITNLYTENQALRQFQEETIKTGREEYAKGLVRAGKYAQQQEADLVAYAQSLDAAGFDAWKKINDAAPVMPIMGQYGQQTYSDPGVQSQAAAADAAKAERISTLTGMVRNHQMANVSSDKIQKMASYQELVKLDPTFAL